MVLAVLEVSWAAARAETMAVRADTVEVEDTKVDTKEDTRADITAMAAVSEATVVMVTTRGATVAAMVAAITTVDTAEARVVVTVARAAQAAQAAQTVREDQVADGDPKQDNQLLLCAFYVLFADLLFLPGVVTPRQFSVVRDQLPHHH